MLFNQGEPPHSPVFRIFLFLGAKLSLFQAQWYLNIGLGFSKSFCFFYDSKNELCNLQIPWLDMLILQGKMSDRLIGRILVPTKQQWTHNCPKHKTKALGEALLAC